MCVCVCVRVCIRMNWPTSRFIFLVIYFPSKRVSSVYIFIGKSKIFNASVVFDLYCGDCFDEIDFLIPRFLSENFLVSLMR